MKSKKVHLICSSGGIKCLSYIGAYRELVEKGFEIASVSACSMGTVIGALICSGRLTPAALEAKVSAFDFTVLKREKRFSVFRYFVYPYATHHTPDFKTLIENLIGEDITLGEMKIPFSAAALDLHQNRFLVYSSGTHKDMRLSEVIKIATAIPFLYEPYRLGKHLLVDAAVASESPVWMALSNVDNYPILVLKTAFSPNTKFKKGYINFLTNLFALSSKSHDYFTLMQTPRSIEVNIQAAEMRYDNFDIKQDEIQQLILTGQDAMSKKLREHGNNFHQSLEVEEIISTSSQDNNHVDRAAKVADQLIYNYQNENLKRSQVFISYSRLDTEWLEKFKSHLKVIESFTGIKVWSDKEISPGEQWNREIHRALASTKVAVFLVTANFLASDFIQEHEMNYFLRISEQETVPIVWISISGCNYEVTPLKHLQCVNDPRQPLDQLSLAQQNMEFARVCSIILEKMKVAPQSKTKQD